MTHSHDDLSRRLDALRPHDSPAVPPVFTRAVTRRRRIRRARLAGGLLLLSPLLFFGARTLTMNHASPVAPAAVAVTPKAAPAPAIAHDPLDFTPFAAQPVFNVLDGHALLDTAEFDLAPGRQSTTPGAAGPRGRHDHTSTVAVGLRVTLG